MKRVLYAVAEYIKQTDKLLWLCCIAASAVSVTMIYSVCFNGFVSSFRLFYIQFAAVLIGIAVAVVLSKIDYHSIAACYKIFTPATLLLVLLTFTPLGIQREGTDDKAWLSLGIVDLQPSELLKIAFVFTFAMHLSKVKDNINDIRNVIMLCLHGAVPSILIVLQGDYGSAIIFVCIFVFMLFAAGISWKYVAVGFGCAAVLLPLFYFFVLEQHHRDRILLAFNPELDAQGGGFQQVQGKTALGSGMLLGRGIFNDNLMEVPEMYNDFIFSYIGQTLGFVGCVAVAAVLLCLCIKILMTARAANDDLGKYICVGIFTIFLIQSVINIGMVLCVMPVIGITLPLISSGGTSVVTMYAAIGIVLSVYMNGTKKTAFDY